MFRPALPALRAPRAARPKPGGECVLRPRCLWGFTSCEDQVEDDGGDEEDGDAC